MNVLSKLSAIRQCMISENIQACIFSNSDPHLSEYPVSHWKWREWISGFTGSNGTLVITNEKAGLWTDSRYFLQAEKELKDSGIKLFKEAIPGTPTISEWIGGELKANETTGLDGTLFSANLVNTWQSELAEKNIGLKTAFSYQEIRTDRPAIPTNKFFILTENFAGETAGMKIERLETALKEANADTTILSSLDTIAWLLNIRGNDVIYNPVVICFFTIDKGKYTLFIDPEKIEPGVLEYLEKNNIRIKPYQDIYEYIQSLPANNRILINPDKLNFRLYDSLPSECIKKEVKVHPADLFKSIKNTVEADGFRNAVRRDGVALVRFHIWLEKAMENEEPVSEITISTQLQKERSLQKYYKGDSFGTIAGYAEHAAINHYNASPETAKQIKPESFLLIDSGGQYLDGTTDITRTIALGSLTEQMKTDYTLVLKGHIALAMAIFPEGTRGVQLDILARKALWKNGLNYLHGTGHGIGHFLNVHEGPQNIRTDLNDVALVPGMVTSNEPGIYRDGEYGIRIENLILTTQAGNSVFGNFYQFETLSLCPIDTKPIVKALLNSEEKDWLNSYHKRVYKQLAPLLTTEEQMWLKEKTKEI